MFTFRVRTVEAVNAAEPAYITLNFPVQDIGKKYMKVVFEEYFTSDRNPPNPNQYLTFNELEVYVKE